MSGDRAIRIATIAVWVIAAGVILTLAFVRGNTPPVASLAAASGARPVVYEFSTDT